MITNISTGKTLLCQLYIYSFRDQLNENVSKEVYLLLVDIDDVSNFDQKLCAMVRNYPMEYLKIVSFPPFIF